VTLQRLRSLESSSDMGVAGSEQELLVFNNAFSTGDVSAQELQRVIAHLDNLDAARVQKLADAGVLKSKLEKA